jgi:hypothetical protein
LAAFVVVYLHRFEQSQQLRDNDNNRRLPANQRLRFATMTVMGGTRQEGAAVDISPLVFPARSWFEFQMYASSWQGTSAVGLDLIAAGVYLLQH